MTCHIRMTDILYLCDFKTDLSYVFENPNFNTIGIPIEIFKHCKSPPE